MLTILIPILIVVLSILGLYTTDKWMDRWPRWEIRLATICGWSLGIGAIYCLAMLAIGINVYFDSRIFVKQFEAAERSVVNLRLSNHKYEGAAAVISIVEMNGKLAEWKYWNSIFICDPWATDKIEDLKPIK